MTDQTQAFFSAAVQERDPLIAQALASERNRQQNQIELIASENIVSRAVLDALGHGDDPLLKIALELERIALQDEYFGRLAHFVKCEIVELKDGTKESEGKLILDKLNQSSFVCLLDVKGRQITSHELSGVVEGWQNRGLKEITFVIGGADGLDPGFAAAAEERLAFGRMTLPHQIVRILAAEQVYRAMTILAGHPYHRA